jgi:glutathione S-transferase
MERIMRFMVIVKASKDTEAGVMPSTEMLAAMGRFNEEMAKAGVIKAGEGLHPTSRAVRIKYAGNGQAMVSSGPFSLSGDLIAGFWLIETASLDEAIGWMKRAPFGPGDEIDIRQVFTADDFGEALTPELREREERLRAQVGT